MSPSLQSALRTYQAGNYAKSLVLLAPVLAKPDVPVEALLLAAQCYTKTKAFAQAAHHYDRAAAIKSGPNAVILRILAAKMLQSAGQNAEAFAAARRAARLSGFDTEAEEIYRRFMHTFVCLDDVEIENAQFLAQLETGDPRYFAVENPLDHIGWCADERLNARISRIQGGTPFTAESRAARRARPHVWAQKIRIGYLSNDYSDQHVTMRLFQGVMRAHDATKFDITHFCYTPADVVSTDKGSRTSYPGLVTVGHLDDAAAEKLIRDRQIDILVEMKGHTKGTRVNLINRGLAPVHVAFLGFPGSGNGIDCDYIISDRVVTPDTSKPFYHEKLCRLPECYQANDDRFRPLPPAATRESLGLPLDRFIFASFNVARKVTPETARLWARIMAGTDGSILWMFCTDPFTQQNFRGYMAKLGIAADRILFAGYEAYPEHIARLQAADLGLDTFPTNGHTTTSDKLWAGLPVATKTGTNFSSRVSESLLKTLGVPELVAGDDDGYVRLCIDLANDPQTLAAVRARIVANRFTAALFDTERFTRHLESAYEHIADRARRGLAPDHIDVPALPKRTEPFLARPFAR